MLNHQPHETPSAASLRSAATKGVADVGSHSTAATPCSKNMPGVAPAEGWDGIEPPAAGGERTAIEARLSLFLQTLRNAAAPGCHRCATPIPLCPWTCEGKKEWVLMGYRLLEDRRFG